MGKYHVKIKNADLKEFKKLDEKTLVVGSKLPELYLEAKTYLRYSLNYEIFPRYDYNHLVMYAAFYLDVSSPKLESFKIHQPGTNHNDHFMADRLYNLAIVIKSGIIDFVKRAATLPGEVSFCALFYAPVPAFIQGRACCI